jgi:hypothetical protein
MSTTAAPSTALEQATEGKTREDAWVVGQSGGVAFPDLVRAHYEWERNGALDTGDAAKKWQASLEAFQKQEGEIRYAYWTTQRPSAVALTMKPRRGVAAFLEDDYDEIRLHRATDWVAPERTIADLMHHCDTLAIRVSEVLRGTTERIAMQWIYAVQSHLLGFVERTRGRADAADVAALVASQQTELLQIEAYYARAGEKAARIVYFWGMMAGALIDGALAGLLLFALWVTGWVNHAHGNALESFFICYVAGGLGAIVSVLMRMSSNKFNVDYEVGRKTIRRLGSFRPFIGAVFGIALYFLVQSGILRIQLPSDRTTEFFFFATLAFLAGFNERWANVLFGTAEQTLSAQLGATKPQAAPPPQPQTADDNG